MTKPTDERYPGYRSLIRKAYERFDPPHYDCPYCDHTFLEKRSYWNHRRNVHANKEEVKPRKELQMALFREEDTKYYEAMAEITIHDRCKPYGHPIHSFLPSTDHPLYRQELKCKVCKKVMKPGQPVTLVDTNKDRLRLVK